jgi:alkylated DNA repair dioxygenase AlkB
VNSLFADPLITGLHYAEDILTVTEEQALIARIDATDLSPLRFQGWLGKRLTKTFGWRYDFDDSSFAPSDPMPDWLILLRDKAADFARLPPSDFVHALVARYDPGAGIGWHRDRPVFEEVVGISLGSEAVLRFRRRLANGKFERASLAVAPRSAYLLTGVARHDWEHRIVPGDTLRYSITFRTFSEKGRRIAAASR